MNMVNPYDTEFSLKKHIKSRCQDKNLNFNIMRYAKRTQPHSKEPKQYPEILEKINIYLYTYVHIRPTAR